MCFCISVIKWCDLSVCHPNKASSSKIIIMITLKYRTCSDMMNINWPEWMMVLKWAHSVVTIWYVTDSYSLQYNAICGHKSCCVWRQMEPNFWTRFPMIMSSIRYSLIAYENSSAEIQVSPKDDCIGLLSIGPWNQPTQSSLVQLHFSPRFFKGILKRLHISSSIWRPVHASLVPILSPVDPFKMGHFNWNKYWLWEL